MKKLIGTNKIDTAIFISGKGTNLKNLIKFSLLKNFPIKINLVISSNKNAKGIKYARKFNIKHKIFLFKKKKKDEKKILLNLKKRKIKLICLAGFLKILSKNFINNFN